jgi:hypothetical protein
LQPELYPSSGREPLLLFQVSTKGGTTSALQAELAALDNTEINQQIRAVDRAIHALENPTAPGPGKGQTLSPEHRAKIKAGLATYNERMKQLKADAKNAATRPVTATAIPAPLLKGKGKPATQPTA